MNTTILRSWVIAGGLIIAMGSIAAATQRKDETARQLKADVAHAGPLQFSMASKEFEGPFTRENVHAQITAVCNELVRQRLDFSFGAFRPKPVIVLQEPPKNGRVRGTIGLTLPPDLKEAKMPAKIQRINFRNAVRHVHVGPPEDLGEVYEQIARVAADATQANAGWPVVLQILDDPTRTKPELVRTVVNIPLESNKPIAPSRPDEE